jgi:hypothetical protein
MLATFFLIPLYLIILDFSPHFSVATPLLTEGRYEVEPFPHPEIPNCYSLRLLDLTLGRAIGSSSNTTAITIHCLPSILVLGFPKCGTSALYNLLELHPSIIGTPNKEYCISRSHMMTYLKGLPPPEKLHGKVLVSGCLFFSTAQQIFRVLKPKPIKTLFIVRDYAERAWAAYNFFCDLRIDFKCPGSTHWATKNHYRSPEMFHEIILAQHRNFTLNIWFPTLLQEAPRYYRDNIHQYGKFLESQDIHVIESNQFETSPDIVWKGIAKFLNYSVISSTASHPQIQLFTSRRYNTQQHKGESKFVSSRDYQSQRYAISGNRPMLPRTREILTERWRPDCLWLKETYHLSSLEAC